MSSRWLRGVVDHGLQPWVPLQFPGCLKRKINQARRCVYVRSVRILGSLQSWSVIRDSG